MSNYQEKYLKYKNKYIELLNQLGGEITEAQLQSLRVETGIEITMAQLQSLRPSYETSGHNASQIRYCISQMKRFAVCMQTDMSEEKSRKYQFFYQIGRIQELLKSIPEIWWKPFEKMIKQRNYDGIEGYTDLLCKAIGCEYVQDILDQGC